MGLRRRIGDEARVQHDLEVLRFPARREFAQDRPRLIRFGEQVTYWFNAGTMSLPSSILGGSWITRCPWFSGPRYSWFNFIARR